MIIIFTFNCIICIMRYGYKHLNHFTSHIRVLPWEGLNMREAHDLLEFINENYSLLS